MNANPPTIDSSIDVARKLPDFATPGRLPPLVEQMMRDTNRHKRGELVCSRSRLTRVGPARLIQHVRGLKVIGDSPYPERRCEGSIR